jgi:acyl carrier protein
MIGMDTDLRQRVLDGIGALLPAVLRQEIPALPETTRLFDELGLSSSKILELLFALEQELEVEIDIEEIDRGSLESIGTFADFVASHAAAAWEAM